jgi:hypothetical protein
MPARKRPQGISYHKWRYATDPGFRKKVAARAHAWAKAHPTRNADHQRNYNLRRKRPLDTKSAAAALFLHWGEGMTWEEAGAAIVQVGALEAPMFTVIEASGRRRKEYLGILERELRGWETHGVKML